MKKLIAMLLALVMVLGLAACGGSSAPAATQAPAAAPAGNAAAAGAEGRVYWLNFKPEADEALQKIAAQYQAETGVPTKIVTAASGTYEQTLTAEMAKSEAPTLFVVGNPEALGNWDEYCLDLTGTSIAGELTTTDYSLTNDAGELKAISYCYESFGIITNVDLLEKAGHSVDEIKDFASLKAVADDIHARAAELGFDAFSSAGLDGSSSWRFSGHLANLPLYYEFRDDGIGVQPATIKGTYMDNFRNIWDLYITDSATDGKTLSTSTGDESKAQFTEGKAVFFQNGSWEFNSLSDAGMNVQMLPIYCGVAGEEKAGLCSGTENCWSVNSQVSEADQKATLDFLYWMVTSEAGTATMVEQFGSIPFKAAPASTNGFILDGDALVKDGCYAVSWAFTATPNVNSWRATVVTALTKYSADPTDANWAEVVSAFVDGWAAEYNMVHG